MKSYAVVFVIGALLVVAGLAMVNRSRTPGGDDRAATSATQPETERYAMSVGRPVELTQGEVQQVTTLAPSVDPSRIRPEEVGKIRAILHSQGNDANKRGRLERLLN
ncbi:hypothetical protein CEW88_14605 [Alloyangia pacifica]|uniref:Uncharacterized protein n=1 Tax=Alloyangia pacifica TaxID=311180 RepID=A0A2U8HGZ0_9RHOB|nr:hypothetical protein [Alloyangia pacifica]AWI85001.1 hypothetical protein CEW88_14605 [Alloyangia pacifica]